MREAGVLLVCVMLLASAAGAAVAGVHQVRDLEALNELCARIANPGDVIEIQPGADHLEASRIRVARGGEPGKPIVVRGVVVAGRTPVIDGSKTNVDRGLFRLEASAHDIVFEDLELRNAKGARLADREAFDPNAGAIYFQGDRITVRRVHAHHNEMGFFASPGADHLLIEQCEVDHNGTQSPEGQGPTHNFYIAARHQTVRNCYIHDSVEAQNFKSRGGSTVFAYNWVEEDAGYSVEVASDNEGNTLWLGNVIVKRVGPGVSHRVLSVGDGVGTATGTLTLINNTVVSTQPDSIFLFVNPKATCQVVLFNNVFAGPASVFLDPRSHPQISGSNNWFRQGVAVPETVTGSLFGADPGFVNAAAHDFRPRPGSPLIGAGLAAPTYRDGEQRLEVAWPEYEPTRALPKLVKRANRGGVDIGALGAAAR